MKRDELILAIEKATGAILEPGLLGDIVDMLARQGFLYVVNEEYQQFPVDQKQVAKFGKVCKADKCMRRVRTHGYCQTHYLQARRKGLIGNAGVCSVEGCDKPVEAKGLCFQHYRSKVRTGVGTKVDQTSSDLDR